MRKYILLFFLCLFISLGFSRQTIKIHVEKDSQIPTELFMSVIDDIKSSITSSQRFIVLDDQNPAAGEEYVLSYLFNLGTTTDSVISESNLNLYIKISEYSSEKSASSESYIQNNDSGIYIKQGFSYIEVQKGKLYSYDTEKRRFSEDPEGGYVKTVFGDYVTASSFYSYYPHEIKSVRYSFAILLSLEDETGKTLYSKKFNINQTLNLTNYSYNSYSNKIEKQEIPETSVFKYLITGSGYSMVETVKSLFKIKTNLIDFSGNRVFFSSGENEGVKKGYLFLIKNGDYKSYAEIKNVNPDTSEGEIINSDYGMTYFKNMPSTESLSLPFRSPVGISGLIGNKILIDFYIRTTDIYGETTGTAGLRANYKFDDFSIFSGISVFRNKTLNIFLKGGVWKDFYYGGIEIRLFRYFGAYADIDNNFKPTFGLTAGI